MRARRGQLGTVLISLGIYVIATMLPALTVTALRPTTSVEMTGLDCLLNGPLVILGITEGLSVVVLLGWLANVPYFAALIALAVGRRWPRAIVASTLLGLLPIVLVLTQAPIASPFGGPFVGPEPSGPTTITSIGIGYVAWLAAMFVPFYAASKTRESDRGSELSQ